MFFLSLILLEMGWGPESARLNRGGESCSFVTELKDPTKFGNKGILPELRNGINLVDKKLYCYSLLDVFIR